MNATRAGRGRPVWLFLGILLAVLCILGAAALYLETPGVDQQLASRSARVTVSILRPADHSHWDVYSPIMISAQTTGAQVKQLVLSVDGVAQPAMAPRAAMGTWTWDIQDENERTLIVTAIDAQGHVFNSNAVRVTGVTPSNPSIDFLYPTKPGDTAASIEAQFGVSPDQLAAANPGVNSSAPFPTGGSIKIPISLHAGAAPASPRAASPPPTQGGPTQPATFISPDKFAFLLSGLLNPKPPAAPTLMLQIIGCTAGLRIEDASAGKLGFLVYRQDPQAGSFSKIATLAPGADPSVPVEYDDPNLSGSFSYYVSAFNGAGEAQSNVVTANLSQADCQSPFWSGLGQPTALHLGFQTSKYDKVYFYVSQGGAVRQRIPADPNQFLSLPGGVFDLEKQVSSLGTPRSQTEVLDVDVWGWAGGALAHIGDFQPVVTSPVTSAPSTSPTKLQICEVDSCKSDVAQFINTPVTASVYSPWDFRWQSDPTAASQGLVQVASVPFARAACSLTPAGLITDAEQTIPARGKGNTDFVIHFNSFSFLQAGTNAFYIRVLPVVNGQTVCEPSNMIEFYVGPQPTFTIPTPAPIPDPYDIKITNVSQFQFGDPSKAYCVHVVKNIFYVPPSDRGGLGDAVWVQLYEKYLLNNGTDPVEAHWRALWSLWPAGSNPCPGTYQPDDGSVIDQAVSLAQATGKMFEDAINGASAWYAGAEDTVVNQVADTTGICDTGVTDPQTCKDGLHAGLAAGLTALGVPPSLPNWGDVVEAGKGQIADAATDAIGDTYCPDKDLCKKLIEQGLDKAVSNLAATGGQVPLSGAPGCMSEEDAHRIGINPMCIPPEDIGSIVITDDPAASDRPSIAQIQITRKADVPASALPNFFKCSAAFQSSAVNNAYLFKTNVPVGYYGYAWPGGEQLSSDSLFETAQINIPPGMAPGDSRTAVVVLTPGWFYVDNYQNLLLVKEGNNYPPDKSEDQWQMLYQGAQATFTATENCTYNFAAYGPLTGVLKDTVNQTIPAP